MEVSKYFKDDSCKVDIDEFHFDTICDDDVGGACAFMYYRDKYPVEYFATDKSRGELCCEPQIWDTSENSLRAEPEMSKVYEPLLPLPGGLFAYSGEKNVFRAEGGVYLGDTLVQSQIKLDDDDVYDSDTDKFVCKNWKNEKFCDNAPCGFIDGKEQDCPCVKYTVKQNADGSFANSKFEVKTIYLVLALLFMTLML